MAREEANHCDSWPRARLVLLFSIVIHFALLISCVHSFQTTTTSSNISETTTIRPTTTTSEEEASLDATKNETITSSAPAMLLSGEEFVDFTEAPTILIDETAEEDKLGIETSSQNKSTAAPEVGGHNGTSSTLSSASRKQETSEDSDSDEKSLGAGQNETTAGGNSGSADLAETEFEAPQNISQYMDYIEKLFRNLRHQIRDLFEPHLPQLIRTSQSVELSSSCSFDMLRMALALRQFEPWALKMIDSSGKLPEGIFEGSFTALGSYDECLSVVFESSSSNGGEPPAWSADNEQLASERLGPPPTQGQFCLVTVSPFLPPKPPTDRVERLFQEEANRRNYTKDNQFSRLSPMFYYMKFRIGVCIPSSCEQADMDSIASALSTNLNLNITIPDCRVKQKSSPLTRHQLVSATIICALFGLVLCATVLDCFKRKSQQFKLQLLGVARGETKETNTNGLVIRMEAEQQESEKRWPGSLFLDRLHKHWTWMSFSLFTNFRLHFKRNHYYDMEKPANQIIRCLNGIRVLSLCWVIIANSYLTLDPRATKRLSKTREAPKDFLFQIVVQASLAIETFFFLSGLLMSLSFSRKFNQSTGRGLWNSAKSEKSSSSSSWFKWASFYIHRYVRMTPATMLVIALTMYAYPFGDGPIWFEATKNSHESCKRNWWRHLLHVANYIDTRQMCFIHYWYISADMQLFVFAPILLFLVNKYKHLGYTLLGLIGVSSIFSVFLTTYERNLPPTLLFYSSDPESRREFGNTIMTKPLTHALPYIVGMLVGQWLASTTSGKTASESKIGTKQAIVGAHLIRFKSLLGWLALAVALAEVFLPYKWNNSHLPTKLMAAIYASLFRLGWSLVLACVVLSCAHAPSSKCASAGDSSTGKRCKACNRKQQAAEERHQAKGEQPVSSSSSSHDCFCGSGGNLINRLLGLNVFSHLSKLSFVAYLIHLPLMSVFIGQTRSLFAFSHTLVVHLAISYLVLTFALSFALVHLVEFPFLTFERLLFERCLSEQIGEKNERKAKSLSFGPIKSSQTKCYDLAALRSEPSAINNCAQSQRL